MSGSNTPTPPPLSLLNFTALVQQMAAAIQGACSTLLDFTVGSVLLAITQGVASVQLWLQWLILLVWQRARLSTCSGADCDSWGADFGFFRLPAVDATGSVTFSRFNASLPALIPLNAQVKTADGSQSYLVTKDTANPLWNSGQGGYLVPANTASATVPIQAVTPGTAANVQPGTITLLGSAVPAVDTVTNSVALTNGVDAESDAAFKARFINYLASLSKATLAAIQYAISTVQQGLTADIEEVAGSFSVYVDDGSGNPPSSTLTAVSEAIEPVRGLGISYAVHGPTLVSATIVLTITAASGYQHANLVGPVATAIETYVNTLPIGSPLSYFRLAAVAYSVVGVDTVEGLTLNGGTSDIGGAGQQVVKVASCTVN